MEKHKPAFLALPVGLLPAGVVFDLIYLSTDRLIWAQTAVWMIAAGLGCALIAAVFGLVDTLSLPEPRAKRISIAHSILDVAVAAVFAASLWVRKSEPMFAASTSVVTLEIVGMALHAISVHLGSELLRELGIGFAVRDRRRPSALNTSAARPLRPRH
jgi:uncharacterized membrane protein